MACTSDGSSTTSPASTRSSASAPSNSSSSSAQPSSPIVGRWQQRHSCEQLVAALRANGLEKVAPAMVGDFFPGMSPRELAGKGKNLCDGAEPQVHGHFFASTGEFGSLDQNGQRVDDGPYEVVNDHVMTIGDARFGYVVDGDVLVLKPLISARDRRAALAAPDDFSTAGWQVAVSYGGRPWHAVPCEGWC
jgi:hypothetical protein